MKINLEDIKIAKSPLTNEVYAGVTTKDNMSWRHKVDVTAYFLRAAIEFFRGARTSFKLGDRKYEITCKDITSLCPDKEASDESPTN